MLAEIVTGHLLETLAARADLDPKVGEALRAALAAQTPAGASSSRPGGATQAELDPRIALAHAETLKQSGRLDDYAIVDALRTNEMMSAKAMLAVKAGVALPVVERACELRSAKAIVSLAWKAGLSPQTAVVLQTMLAHLAAAQTLRPGKGRRLRPLGGRNALATDLPGRLRNRNANLDAAATLTVPRHAWRVID